MLKVDRISEKVPGIVMEFISEKAYAPCISLYSGRIKCSQLFFYVQGNNQTRSIQFNNQVIVSLCCRSPTS